MMRKAITFLLLAASTAAPLSAQAWSGPGQGPERAGRDSSRTDRIANPRRDWREAERDRAIDARRDGPGGVGQVDARRPPPGDRDGDRNWGDGNRGDRGRGDRRADNDGRGWNDPREGRGGRDASRSGYRWSENRRGGWDDRWRDDRRYDWQGYRAGNRAIYRAPRYFSPRGAGYSRWSLGRRVDPFYYGRSYWIADPWRYRLPPAYGDYRWVRYYDDVALIDVRSGLIADIIYSFFWR